MEVLFLLIMLGGPLLLGLFLKTRVGVRIGNFFDSVFQRAEGVQAHAGLWIITLLSIMLLRDYIENFSVPFLNIYDVSTRLEYFLFWVPIALSLMVLAVMVTGEKISKVSKVVVFLWPITLLPPIIDFLISGGNGITMTYILNNFDFQYFTFMDITNIGQPATIGIKIEVILASLIGLFYVFSKTRSVFKTAITPLAVYSGIFFFMSTPVIASRFWKFLVSDTQISFNVTQIVFHLLLILIFVVFWGLIYRKQKNERSA